MTRGDIYIGTLDNHLINEIENAIKLHLGME
jgi:mRNA-degrading endonuclease toxin of MazEF toxin-antitoxin module